MSFDNLDIKINNDIKTAEKYIIKCCHKDNWYKVSFLKKKARGNFSSAIMGLAVDNLIKEGILVENFKSLKVKLGTISQEVYNDACDTARVVPGARR